MTYTPGWKPSGPAFNLEEISCVKFFGDSFTISPGRNRQCSDNRFLSYENSLYFPEKPNTVCNDCWLALNCYLTFTTDLYLNYDDICQNETCKKITENDCPDMFYMPNAPIAFGHIYFAYTKKYIIEQKRTTNNPEYICYNEQLCGGFLSNTSVVLFNNTTCRRPQDFPLECSDDS